MTDAYLYPLLANLILALHLLVVMFVVGGLAVVPVGNRLRWHWVNRRGFRLTHLAAVLFIVAESWIGMVCPLTTLENRLRAQAGEGRYDGGFIAHWMGELLYYQAPGWVFVLIYTAFAGLVALAWWRYPPQHG